MTNEIDPREEIVARAIVDSKFGGDPMVTKSFIENIWVEYVPMARAILAALDAARPVEPPADEEVATWSQNVGAVRAAWLPLPSIAPHAREAPGITTGHVLYLLTRATEITERQQAEIARLTAERDKAERKMIEWRSAVQSCTPGGSEFMSPQAVLDWLQKMKTDRSRALATSVANAQRATAAEAEIADLRGENTRLRAALANSDQSCAYCTLSAEDWSKCASGFPGCARADDAMGCPEFGASLEIADLRAKLATAVEALEPFADMLLAWPDERRLPDDWPASMLFGDEGLRTGIHWATLGDLRRARTALDAITEDRT